MPALQHVTYVDSYVLGPEVVIDINGEGGVWDIALDQQLFGAGQLVVVTTDATGKILTVAHCKATEPPIGGLACCLEHVRTLADDEGCAAVAFSDEPVKNAPPSEEHRERWEDARTVAEERGYHLLDWMACCRPMIRSLKLSFGGDEDEWWDLPA